MFSRIKIFFLIFICICIFSSVCYTENSYYSVAAIDALGGWRKDKIDDKDVILTDKADTKGYIELEVPEDGFYQLYVSLYHSWRKYCPFLYFEVIDSKGKFYSSYIFSEPRWYLERGRGRWEFRSPTACPFLYLAKGKLKIKFWPESKKSCWDQKEAPMEGEVAIDKFVLIRVDKEKMIHKNIRIEK